MTKIYYSILLLMTAFSLRAQDFSTTQNCATNPPDFSKLSYEQASQIIESEERKKICPEYISNLVNQLRHGKLSNDNKILAIYLLGELHPSDTNSIEFLIENIDFRATRFDPKTALQRWGYYPAEEALIKIGKPVVDPILNRLPKETNELRRQLMCDVLKQVWQQK